MAIKAVYADHGDLAPDAIGVLLEIKGIKLYFAGDTAYRPEKMQKAMDFMPDILNQALEIVKPGGVIALIGFYEADLNGFSYKIVGSNAI